MINIVVAAEQSMASSQQLHVTARCRGVDGDRLLGAKAVQIMRPACFGPSGALTFAAKGLHAHHGTNLVAIDVDVAHMRRAGEGQRAGVDAGLDAQR